MCSFIASEQVFRNTFALSGDSTHPISRPIQFLNGVLRPAAVSSLQSTASLPSNPP